IGVNAVVLPHVKVGRGAVVGANSVVTKNVAPYSIVAGAPASHIRYRFGEEERRKAMEVDIDYFKNPKHAAEAYNRSKDTPVK
ncbi:MAG TPA: antibiotic acetyltransferase, partial [Rhodospirillales bacterium]|nr:antibiotic acetyltransferase [Rhodospirillales bacterium]